MDEYLENKINEFKQLAKASIESNLHDVAQSDISSSSSEDSLAKSIRNQGEAALFMAELNAAISNAR